MTRFDRKSTKNLDTHVDHILAKTKKSLIILKAISAQDQRKTQIIATQIQQVTTFTLNTFIRQH